MGLGRSQYPQNQIQNIGTSLTLTSYSKPVYGQNMADSGYMTSQPDVLNGTNVSRSGFFSGGGRGGVSGTQQGDQ